LAEGGFGQVFEAEPEHREADSRTYVIKLVPKEPGAERELLFPRVPDARNVVPVLDRGETNHHYFLIMPRADQSLKDAMVSLPFTQQPVIAVAVDIADALGDLDGFVVHRDIKPANILRLDGRWCLSDFGISRYAEASTAPLTRKLAMTAAYAAPERWRYQHATSSTDVYSLGITLYEMLAGFLPFAGPTREDYREQHLHSTAPVITTISPELDALVRECLYKAPESRPTARAISRRLRDFDNVAADRDLDLLKRANQKVSIQRADHERESSQENSDAVRREELVDSAFKSFTTIATKTSTAVSRAAPEARTLGDDAGDGWKAVLGSVSFRLAKPRPAVPDVYLSPTNSHAIHVVAYSSIGLEDADGLGLSHSLWYCNAADPRIYRWYEIGFSGRMQLHSHRPFALDPHQEEAAVAIRSDSLGVYIEFPFEEVSFSPDGLIRRWTEHVAKAVEESINH
jgi:serine/threonine-protein kinase